jgi:hypothetical protein
MILPREIEAFQAALLEVLAAVQVFKNELATPRTLAALTMMAQTTLFDFGTRHGYDWRCVHLRAVSENGNDYVIRPEGLSDYGNRLLDAAMSYKKCDYDCVARGYPEYECSAHGYKEQHGLDS